MPLALGTRLGAYEITGELGAGGMGEVYRATDTVLKRQVALKVLPPEVADDSERVARFQREAEVLASLNHPNIAHLYGLERSDGTLALVMELVEGPTLADRIARGVVPLDEALPIAKQIAEALEAAHEQGIIHRDLKPANIKVRDDGTVKVLDFGLAKAMATPATNSAAATVLTNSPTVTSPALMTGIGVLLGTAAYMSPEQAKGRPADKRSDVWAFGCVLYEMCAGKRAFEGEDVADTLAAVLRGAPDWNALPRTTPPAIQTIVRGCLEKDRQARIADVSVIKFLFGHSFSTPVPVGRSARRALVLAGTALAAIAVGAAAWVLKPTPSTAAAVPVRFALTPSSSSPLLITSPFRDFVLSPDGSRIAFVVGSGAFDNQLMTRALGELDAAPVRGAANVANPFFSPDGRWIGFFNNATRQVMKIPTGGGPPSVICLLGASLGGATWTADGRIVFGTTDPGGLFVVPDTGGQPKALTTPDSARGETSHVLPAALPNGDLLFTALTAGAPPNNRNVMLFDHVSGQSKVLIAGGGQPEYIDPDTVVYAFGGSLRAARLNMTRGEIVGEPTPMVNDVLTKAAGGFLGIVEFSVSRNGTLAYSAGGTIANGNQTLRTLVWVNRRGEEILASPSDRIQRYARYQLIAATEQVRTEWKARTREALKDLKNTEVQERTIKGGVVKVDPVESKLQNELRQLLQVQFGKKCVEAERNFVDLTVTTSNRRVLLEIKSDPTARSAIRAALGQLLDYAYFARRFSEKMELVIVGQGASTPESDAYLRHLTETFRIPIRYQQFQLGKKDFVL
jgi:serine/threonine-protein kinase